MTLQDKFILSLTEQSKYFEDKPNIAVGVSGGPDSVALVHLLKNWIKHKDGNLTALVFNHGIRNNSEEESFQVKRMLEDFKIKTIILKPKKNNTIKKNMANARDNRFEGMINFCIKKNILHLFLGHHFDDNLETFLIRKINGSNVDGLAAINIITYLNKTQIIRPLINNTKIQILNFNKKNNLNFISDPSNNDISYTRVKVRKFLQNKNYKNQVKNDFLNLKKQIPNYKQMVWETLIYLLVDIYPHQITVNYNKLIILDELIIEKQILSILKFLTNSKNQTKSSKIMSCINLLKKSSFKKFNLSGVNIQKNSNFLIFSLK